MGVMEKGVIYKALSGFYYVKTERETVKCRARGRFRHENITPLVGDRVELSVTGPGEGVLDEILSRKNSFTRPPVANVDQLVILASNTVPVTEPFLIDQLAAIGCHNGAKIVICLSKCDLDPADELFRLYSAVGFPTVRTSAATGEGVGELLSLLRGSVSVLTGNSGVGKSSLLNALDGSLALQTGEVSEKLGRGRHTTRHIELFDLAEDAVVADTPGFSAFDLRKMSLSAPSELPYAFQEFRPFLESCRFTGCSHRTERGCAVLAAVERGEIPASRHKSYVRLYNQLNEIPHWELEDK